MKLEPRRNMKKVMGYIGSTSPTPTPRIETKKQMIEKKTRRLQKYGKKVRDGCKEGAGVKLIFIKINRLTILETQERLSMIQTGERETF